MKKPITLTFLFLVVSITFSGCSSYMHGYTKSEAKNQYMKIDVKKENFGFQRINYIIKFRGDAVADFIDEKGYPDFLYEYEKLDSKGDEREGFIFYYFEEDKAYDFMEENWQPTSARIVEIREFSKFEKDRFGM